MEMTDDQRLDLALRLQRIVTRNYGGNAKRAYTDAGINSGTWTRASTGQTIKRTSLVPIVRAMWPETDGDWELIDPPLGSGSEETRSLTDLVEAVEGSNLAAWAKDWLLRILNGSVGRSA